MIEDFGTTELYFFLMLRGGGKIYIYLNGQTKTVYREEKFYSIVKEYSPELMNAIAQSVVDSSLYLVDWKEKKVYSITPNLFSNETSLASLVNKFLVENMKTKKFVTSFNLEEGERIYDMFMKEFMEPTSKEEREKNRVRFPSAIRSKIDKIKGTKGK